MIVDPDFFRMGADFSESAGSIARQGGAALTATQISAGAFGAFAEAESFHRLLSQAQTTHATNMAAYHATFAGLAEKSNAAATIFTNEDEGAASSIRGVDFGTES